MYQTQKDTFINTIEKLKTITFADNVSVISLDTWVYSDGKEIGAPHFPLWINMKLSIENISDTDINIYLDTKTFDKMDKIEIVSINTNERKQYQGYGKILIEQIEYIAKELEVQKIYGDYLTIDSDGYSSRDFYEKCGYETDNQHFQKILS